MIQNCTLYLATDKLNTESLPPGASNNGGLMRKATAYQFEYGDGPVELTVMEPSGLAEHLNGFQGYVMQLENPPADLQKAAGRIAATRMVLGVHLGQPIHMQSDTFAVLMNIVKAHGGFMFVLDSILTPEGFLVGPASYPEAVVQPVATVDIGDVENDSRPPTEAEIARREATLTVLDMKGFRCAPSLPLVSGNEALRPMKEIAARFGAAAITYLYCVAPEEFVSTEELLATAAGAELSGAFTPKETAIMALPRDEAREQHGPMIGWSLENMWALAWVMGFEHDIEIDSGMIGEAPSVDMRYWMPINGQSMANVLERVTPRTYEEVAAREDLFYCAHNAVRSAQMGHPTVPSGFDPMGDGGTVHERRHSLTWCLSPGVLWDNTDLST